MYSNYGSFKIYNILNKSRINFNSIITQAKFVKINDDNSTVNIKFKYLSRNYHANVHIQDEQVPYTPCTQNYINSIINNNKEISVRLIIKYDIYSLLKNIHIKENTENLYYKYIISFNKLPYTKEKNEQLIPPDAPMIPSVLTRINCPDIESTNYMDIEEKTFDEDFEIIY